MNQWNKKQITKRRSTAFKPTHNEIKSAVDEYLKGGGTITKILPDDSNYNAFINKRESSRLVDDFLFGN